MHRASCYLTAFCGLLGSSACGNAAADARPGSGGAATSGGQTTTGGAAGALSDDASAGMASISGGVAGAGGSGTSEGGSAGGGGGSAPTIGGAASASGQAVVFVGGFGADPVHVYDLDKSTGVLTERLPTVDAGPEPSCFALDPSRSHLYVCNEDDGAQGGVTSFTLQADGSITKLNHQLGSDGGYTQVAVTPNGKYLAGAGYNGGSASLFPVMPDGSLGPELDVMDFGANAQTHYVAFDPTGKYLLATTKGTSAVQQMKLDDTGMLSANTPSSVATPSGVGPRHMAMHPNGKLAFVVTERGSTVIPYQLSATGTLTAGSTVSSLPPDYDGSNSGAHVELSPDGSRLYVSNRGHDSVGLFNVDPATGGLTLVTHARTQSASPHDFDIDAEGQILITANRKGNTLSVFKIAADGTLTLLGKPVPTRVEPTGVLIHDLK
jgi:6-phosphogluconolactonase